MDLNECFAASLRRYRTQLSLTQETLASKSSLDRTYVSLLERGEKSPTLTTLQKLADTLGVPADRLLRELPPADLPDYPSSYLTNNELTPLVVRSSQQIPVDRALLTAAINETHDMIDDLYAASIDIAAVLGMRNLSSFIGELYATAFERRCGGLFRRNPHQDGYPDLLLMDKVGVKAWESLRNRYNEKTPFSPFPSGGIEVKATCGSIPTAAKCLRAGYERPGLGDSRISCVTSYDWKAHHRDTNNLIGVLWDFIHGRPRIAALFFSSSLQIVDWGAIVQPREGGGRTTSVSIMGTSGIRKMYEGWVCVLKTGGYRELIDRKNRGSLLSNAI